jgi:16S rRNA (guanine1207-N2)-methyltransferase
MSHYYINDKNLKDNEAFFDVQIDGTSFRFYTNDGVFSKRDFDFGSYLLIKSALGLGTFSTVIDMGCGYGPIGIIYSKFNNDAKVYMYDVNLRALDLARKNMILNNVSNAFAFESYLFEKVEVKADLILTNPPIRAGKSVIFKLYEDAYKHLNENGVLLVVIQRKQGAPSTMEKLKSIYNNVEVIEKKGGYWIISAAK